MGSIDEDVNLGLHTPAHPTVHAPAHPHGTRTSTPHGTHTSTPPQYAHQHTPWYTQRKKGCVGGELGSGSQLREAVSSERGREGRLGWGWGVPAL